MIKKDSIFIKVLIPVILVMMLQVIIISGVLFVNGTIDSLGDSAIESLRKNAENRSIGLEDIMIFYWSNLDRLEADVTSGIRRYLSRQNLSITDAIGDKTHERAILDNLSDSLIVALRQTSATGVFMYFVEGGSFSREDVLCNGLYYRDLDPVSTPADYSDVMFARGFIDIARKDNIQLDSLWTEVFSFSPQYTDTWRGFSAPQLAAAEYPDASSVNLSYWNSPHFQSPDSALDSTKCITYTRPVFVDGKLVAVIGTEVQVNHMENYFPASDYDKSGKSGYMLIEYSKSQSQDGTLDCNVYMVNGSYIKRLINHKGKLRLVPTGRTGVYTTATTDNSEGVQITVHPLRLYNSNTPFNDEQWALAAIGADSLLFEASRNVSRGIMYSSATALLVGIALLAITIQFATKPFISIANQIENGAPDDPIVIAKSNAYETRLLSSTINAMKEKRRATEAQLREERERYLIALESAADTFMEYDTHRDSFMLYYFSGEIDKPQPRFKVIERFMGEISAGGFCHPDDAEKVRIFFGENNTEPIEVRAKVSLFSHIKGAQPDGEYYWFLLKASRIYDKDGRTAKIIGIAKEITAEKLREFARVETERRDPTTGLYNRDYGMSLAKSRTLDAMQDGLCFAVCLLHVDDFDMFEAYYGRFFGGLILMRLGQVLRGAKASPDVAVRLTNDDFLILFSKSDCDAVLMKLELIRDAVNRLYVGENPDLCLGLSVGVALNGDGESFEELSQNASLAARHASRNGGGIVLRYGELPEQARLEPDTPRDKPVGVFLDITKESIVGFVFEFLERTSDVRSAINMLLPLLGDMYLLRRIVIHSYDADFGANLILCQWCAPGEAACQTNIEKISFEDWSDFESLLDENGAMLYNSKTLENRGDGMRKLLSAPLGEAVDAYCCSMYENDVQVGRILYMSESGHGDWNDHELITLYEITKIIAAHLSIEKSNSASRAKSEFLSRISHEIRTPMNAIIGMTDIARHSVSDTPRLEDCLEKIDFSAKHLLSLINDVLEMSRIESGKLQIENKPFSLTGFADGIDTLMRPPIEGKSINFAVNLEFADNIVSGDEYRLRQVIVNLLGNANKFTAAGGTITFSITESRRTPFESQRPDLVNNAENPDGEYAYFRFSVRDDGIGISPEEQPLIFRAFEQADAISSSSKHQGTGLGLAISGNIISAMGSRIELDSAPGQGSEFFFTVCLPLCGVQEQADSEPLDHQDYADKFTGKNALLVEDNEINVEIASYILEEAGLNIDLAVNGKEAVEKFCDSEPGYYDIIFMDIQMPIMDGLTATREIRKNDKRPDARTVPIIAMTANAFDEDMKKSIESGMNGHVAKPIDMEKLYSLLVQLLGNKEDHHV